MTLAAPKAIAVANALEGVMRSDRGRLIAVLAAGLRDLSLAEEVLQEAAVSALSHWGRNGLPASPQGWLLQVARRKAIDRLRSTKRDTIREKSLLVLTDFDAQLRTEDIPDVRLQLIFTCCHPALELKSQIALTLRTVCGLTTPEIARAFLDHEPTMGQRLSRAKAKIAAAGIPFKIPAEEDWPQRLAGVLATIYLIFTAGYLAGPNEPRDLCREAEFLLQLINQLRPDDPEIEGALALVLLTGGRRGARLDASGATVPPGEQNRDLWDFDKIEAGREILMNAMGRGQPGPYQIKAAIADCQTSDGGPDWPQIAALYRALWAHEPTAVIALNAAVALAEAGYAREGLAQVESLANQLGGFQPFHAAHADLLAKTGALENAQIAYMRAIEGALSDADRLLLERRMSALEGKA